LNSYVSHTGIRIQKQLKRALAALFMLRSTRFYIHSYAEFLRRAANCVSLY